MRVVLRFKGKFSTKFLKNKKDRGWGSLGFPLLLFLVVGGENDRTFHLLKDISATSHSWW
jgi:hypothetical protein